MGALGNSSCNSIDAALWGARTCPIGAGNSFSMSTAGGSESVSSRVGHHLVPCPDGSRNEPEPCNGQLRMRMSPSLASPHRDPNPAAQPPGAPISPAGGRSAGDARAESVGNLQVGLSSSILLSTSADVLQGVGSTSCNLLPNSSSSRSSLAQSLAPLPQHRASIFADLTNAPASQPSAGAESQLELPSAATVSGSADDFDHVTVVRVGLADRSRDPSFPSTGGSATTDGPGADELDLMVLGSPQSNSASKSMLPIMNSPAGVATSSGDHDAVMTVEHGKLEKSVSELDQELLEVGELEDGELSGGWESGEDDDDADNADPMNFRDGKHEEDEAEEEDEEAGIVDYRTEGLTPVVMRFGVDGRINQATVGGGFGNKLGKDHKKNSKRRKGKGALSRQRKRSRPEKAQTGSNKPIIDVSVDGRQQGDHVTSTTRVKSSGAGRKAGEKQQQSGCKMLEADTGPEEGEVVEEDNRGLLSQLVEEEVGLWTTDIGDEQITSSKIDSDEDGKKKARGPISAERKLKKKVAFRRKRAEKEKELGNRRPRLPVNTFKPKVPLCKFYIKGRCTLGAKCTFSHDVVPITKSDPCKFFMVNRCLKGDDCPFSHTLDTFPCKFWHTRGHCLDGNNCRFSHGPLTDDQRQNLAKRIEHDSKEQLNVPDVPTDFNYAPDDSESEYMPIVNSSQNEALGWDVNPPQVLNQGTTCSASTSMASQSLLNNREVPSAALRTSFVANQSSAVLGEVNREDIQLTDTYKEDAPAENAVLLAARKAASAAAVQAAGTTDKLLLSRSGSVTGISLPKSRSFGRSLAGRGSEASAMDLLQASFSSDGGHDLSMNANSSSQAVSNTGTLSALALSSAGAVGDMILPSSSPLSRAAPSSLARGSSFGHTRQVVVPGNKASAMELLQASLGNEATPEDNTREVNFPGL